MMELSSLIFGRTPPMDTLYAFGFFLLIFCIGWGIPYLSYKLRGKVNHPWQILAASHNFRFIPGSFLRRGVHIVGNYRGYHLALGTVATMNTKQGIMYFMRLDLSLNPPIDRKLSLSQKIPLKDIKKLLSSQHFSYDLVGEVKAEANGKKISYEQTNIGLETDQLFLEKLFDLLSDILDIYPRMVNLGGKVVPSLQMLVTQDNKLKQVCAQLLEDISTETTNRIRDQAGKLFCPQCLTCCSSHKANISWWKSIIYYGCRACHNSQDLLKGRLILILDNGMRAEQNREEEDIILVNWLIRRKLFDFDEVRIKDVTDEDVERFAVQIGNDTDEFRKPRYQQMTCTVSQTCHLSENTLRILKRTFGQVVVE